MHVWHEFHILNAAINYRARGPRVLTRTKPLLRLLISFDLREEKKERSTSKEDERLIFVCVGPGNIT